MLTWHLFTSAPTVLFEQNGQTVLLQTQCLISKPVDSFWKLHDYRVLCAISARAAVLTKIMQSVCVIAQQRCPTESSMLISAI